MKLTVLGKYGPFAINGGNTSGYLVTSGDKHFLLDVGAGVVSKMLNKIDINNLQGVFLSHLHHDHISDLGVLSYAVTFLKKDKHLKVFFCDDGSATANYIKTFSAFEFINYTAGKNYVLGEFSFTPYKMTHPVLSHGIKISSLGRTLSYTGDTTYNLELENLIDKTNLLLADGAFLQKHHNENKPHMSVAQVKLLAEKHRVKTIVTHLGYHYTDNEIESEINNSPFVAVAKEEKTYTV